MSRIASWKKSTLVYAPVENVFAYVDEPLNLAVWLPTMVEVRGVVGTGAGQQFEWTSKMAGRLLHGQATVVEHVPNKYGIHQAIGMVESTFGYFVEPQDGGTVLRLEIEYRIPIPVVGSLAEHVLLRRNAREFEVGLTTIKEVMEA